MSFAMPILIAALSFGNMKGESVEINALRCDFDRNEGVAFFDGNVVIKYNPGYILHCEQLYAFFMGTNKLDRIVALGNVAVTNETRFGTCDRAIFRRRTGELEMYAGETAPALLVDPGANEMRGDTIKFWINAEQVEVTGCEITIDKGKDKDRKEAFGFYE